MESGVHNRKISVIGLGYVGLPVAIHFGRQSTVIGYDKSENRISELKQHYDKTGEASADELKQSRIIFTHDPSELTKADFHIIAVPTPVDKFNTPDLTILLNASKTVGTYLKRGDIVVYESTVYPGATEDDCVPVLENVSGLKCGQDFFVGYSPERINPGDKEHTLTKVVKVVSAQDPRTLDIIANVYGSIVTAGIHRAPTIRTAEAAKIIENTQRDLNIALMNELSLIFDRMNIKMDDVLKAANTKWNFLPFKPGLVGGHCIGVDPYYLTHQAKNFGYHPEVILAGRRINDNMGKHVAAQTVKHLIAAGHKVKGARIGILGLAFKEDCSDLRNTRVIDIIDELKSYGAELYVHGPWVDKKEAKDAYNLELHEWDQLIDLDAMIIAVGHTLFKKRRPEEFVQKFRGKPIIMDVKSILDKAIYAAHDVTVWSL